MIALSGTRSTAAQAAPTAKIRIAAPITNLDPVSLPKTNYDARDIAENLFVGLIRYNPELGVFEKALASEITPSVDNLTWTFKLRTDILWVRNNPVTGVLEALRPVTAGDFVYGLRRACDSAPPNPNTPSVMIVAGCATINNANPLQVNDIFIARNLSVTAKSADVLEIKFAFPAIYTQALLALPEFRPIPREAISRASQTTWATSADTILTNGPYVVKSWSNGEITLIRNPFWAEAVKGNLEEVTFSPNVTKPDIQRTTPSQTAPLQAEDYAIAVGVQSVTVLGFSGERPGMGNEAIRRGFAFGLNRATLATVANSSGNNHVAASRFYPADTQPDPSGYNAEAGRNALKTSPSPGCTRLPDRFEIGVEESQVPIANAMIESWRNALGCNPASFIVRGYPANRLLNIARGSINIDENQKGTPRPHLWLTTWVPDYLDPHAWLGDALHCQYGFLRTNLPCTDADKQVEQGGTMNNPQLYVQAQSEWFGPQGIYPVVPLYTTLTAVAIQPTLNGVGVYSTIAPFRIDQWSIKQ
jgi:ABC-type oligopeptide transport system substrate-binding subunit